MNYHHHSKKRTGLEHDSWPIFLAAFDDDVGNKHGNDQDEPLASWFDGDGDDSQQQQQQDLSSATQISTPSTTTPGVRPHRRPRYQGRYPRNFGEKYKEHAGDPETMEKVLSKGMTPAGTHVPIMLDECLEYLGLLNASGTSNTVQHQHHIVVDCTLGYGGHSSHILNSLIQQQRQQQQRQQQDDADENNNDSSSNQSKLIAFDQDSVEIVKTEERIRSMLTHRHPETDTSAIFTVVNQNFETLKSYLKQTDQLGRVTALLADLGVSSMQLDDNTRGFTYKREGPLDMRMNTVGGGETTTTTMRTTETAYELLSRLTPRQFQVLLEENSDEVFAAQIAFGLLSHNNNNNKNSPRNIPRTTLELADRVRAIVRPHYLSVQGKSESSLLSTKEAALLKKTLDKTVARTMQALRIELNGEFRALERLMKDLPDILAPHGRAVFLTFHSGEDRRVKKALKAGFKNGTYHEWSRIVLRPTSTEQRNNPRSSGCKLRWAIRARPNQSSLGAALSDSNLDSS